MKQGKSVIVSGGTGGLGPAVISSLIEADWHVVVPYRATTEPTQYANNPAITLIQADMTDPTDLAKLTDALRNPTTPPLRAVVNLIGGFAMGNNVAETECIEFDRLMKLNVQSLYLLSQAAIPHLLESGGGSLVTISSQAAVRPFPGAAGYITSKAAVLALTETLSVEYGQHGIRSNAILPGVIDTPANRSSQPDADYSEWIAPEAIADVITFLCSDQGAAINGAQIPVHPSS